MKIIPEPVTDFGTSILEIKEEDFYRLPKDTQELLRHFLIPAKNVVRFEVPNYRLREITYSQKKGFP